MINENFVFLGALIYLFGGGVYILETLKGKVKPNRVSWGLWTVAVMIAFYAEIKQGVGIQSLATFMVGFVPFLIFLASFINKNAYWKLTKFDFACGLLSVSGLIFWYLTKNPNMAILFSILADLAAGVPTLIKSYKYPETENWKEYVTAAINVSIAMLTLKTFSFAYLAFPLYIFCYDFIAFILIKFELGKRSKEFV